MAKSRSLRPKAAVGSEQRLAPRAAMGSAASLSFFRMIAEHGSDVASVHKRDGTFVFVAPTVERLLGWRDRDLMGESLVDLVHRDEQLPLRLALQVEAGTERAAYRVRCADGLDRWVESVVQPGPTSDVVLCMTRDVSEHKRATSLLEQGLYQLLDRAPVASLIVQGGRVRWANLSALERLGDAADVVGQRFRTLLHPDDATREDIELSRVESEGIALPSHRLRVTGADGSFFEAESYAISVAREGQGAALVVIHPNAKLEPNVIAADRLRTIGAVTAGVAHQLSAPLGILAASIEALQGAGGRPLDDEQKAALMSARAAIDLARTTCKSLEVFAQRDDVRTVCDLRSLVGAASTLGKAQLGLRATLECVLPDEPMNVLADPPRLAQALLNVVLNAVYAANHVERGHVRIVARRDKGAMAVEVSDSGPGMDAATRERVFEPFFTTKATSAGLGLSVAHDVLEALRGTLQIVTDPGSGTSVKITLPAEAPPRRTSRSMRAPKSTRGVERRPSLLIVDDDDTLGLAMARALRTEFEVAVASSAKNALARLEEGARFDAIFCDVMMRDMSGLDLHARIAQSAPESAGRVLFATGAAVSAEMLARLGALPNVFLKKPFGVDALRAKLREVVKKG